MARIEFRSLNVGVAQNRAGDVRVNAPFTTTAVVYSAATGATALAALELVTNADGERPGWLDPGLYSVTDAGKTISFAVNDGSSSPVQSVAGRAGAVVLAKADVGLASVDNTTDVAKPVSTAQQAALDLVESKAGRPIGVTGLKPWLGDRSAYNVVAATRRTINAALARQDPAGAADLIAGNPLRVLCIGDSNTNGSAASAPLYRNAYAGRLGAMLARSFGDAGIGATAHPSGADSRLVYSAGWVEGGVGFLAASNTANGVTRTATFGPIVCNKISVLYRKGTAEGTWTYSLDGAAAVSVNANNATDSVASVLIDCATSASHTLVITAPASGNVTLLAVEALNTGIGGAEVIRVGQGGANTGALSVGGATSGHVATCLALAPDVITVMFGTNDFGTASPPVTPTVYGTNIDAFMTAMEAAGIPVVLMVEPTPQAPRNAQTTYPLSLYRQKLYDLADSHNAVIVDLQDRWGTWVQANAAGFMGDDYHASNAGHADIARALYEALFGAWRSITAPSIDSTAVHKTGDETVSGNKTLRPATTTAQAITIQGQPGLSPLTGKLLRIVASGNVNSETAYIDGEGRMWAIGNPSLFIGDFTEIVANGQLTPYIAASSSALLYISVATLALRNVTKVTNDNNTFFESSADGIRTIASRRRSSTQSGSLFEATDENGAVLSKIGPLGAFKHLTSTTAARASAVTVGAGTEAYDTTLSKPIWSDGTVWRDAAGAAV